MTDPSQRRYGLYLLFVSSVVILLFVSWSAYILIHPHYGLHPSAQKDSHSVLMKDIHAAQRISSAMSIPTTHQTPHTTPHTKSHTPPPDKTSHTNQISPPPSSSSLPKLHAITYASHSGRDDRFCRAVESATRASYNLTILNWQVPWEGLAQKLTAMDRYLQDLPEGDIVLFSDAFDVLYTMPREHLLKMFVLRGYRILFAGECGCWPHVVEDPKACTEGYPKAPTPYRYLNSGTYMGYVRYVRPMLKDVIAQAGASIKGANDQKLVADMFIAKTHPISLDYNAEIFQSMHSTDPPGLPYCHPRKDIQVQRPPDGGYGVLVNTRTKTTPGLFHFNGGGKAFHLELEASMPYKTSAHYAGQRLRDLLQTPMQVVRYAQAGRREDVRIPFQDMCMDYARKEATRLVSMGK